MSNDVNIASFGLSATDLQGRLLEYDTDLLNEQKLSTTVVSSSQKLPLSFADFTFDIALCAYIADLQVIRELARVAKEVRIAPLIDHQGALSPLVGPVLLGLQQDNYGVEVKDITLPVTAKKNAVLRVWAKLCHVT